MIVDNRAKNLMNRKGEWGQNLPPRLTIEDDSGNTEGGKRKEPQYAPLGARSAKRQRRNNEECKVQEGQYGKRDQDDPPPSQNTQAGPKLAKCNTDDYRDTVDAQKVQESAKKAKNVYAKRAKRGVLDEFEDQPRLMVSRENTMTDYFVKVQKCNYFSSLKIEGELHNRVNKIELDPQQKVKAKQSLYKGHSEKGSFTHQSEQSAKSTTEEGSSSERQRKVQSANPKVQTPEGSRMIIGTESAS